MMRSLLASEFRLQVHAEQRPQNGFVLSLIKARGNLRPAAAVSPTAVPPGCRRSAPEAGRQIDCFNVTMADLAERLPNEAPAEIDRTVVDHTQLTGSFDLTLIWATESDGRPDIFQALATQPGLRLQRKKLLLPVLVIDHAEQIARE
jgi:uncharacterized protein (TIGR03435 family)